MSADRSPSEFPLGLRHGIPIALGYFAVSIAIGLMWNDAGYPPLSGAVMSALNLSSTGQYSAIAIMAGHGGVLELAATTALVNSRYVLMSLALSQRLAPGTGVGSRLLMAFGVTDEIFALGVIRRPLGPAYQLGLMTLPILGWSGGTVVGALAGEILPESVRGASGILLFAMFVAIVVPPAREQRSVLSVVALAAGVGTLLWYVPGLDAGWRIIITTLVAGGAGAWLFPLPSADDEPARAEGVA